MFPQTVETYHGGCYRVHGTKKSKNKRVNATLWQVFNLIREFGLTSYCVRSLCCEWPKFKESGLDQMSHDRQPSAGKDKRQHHGDSRARLSGLEGHPVFPVVPGVQCMASLSGSI